MVSIKTVLTLAALGVGVVVFFGAGGFKGVGQKIGGFVGGGLSDFSSSLTSALTGGLFGGAVNPGIEAKNLDTGTIGPAARTGTEGFDPIGNLIGNFKGLQNILDSLNNSVLSIFQPAQAASLTPRQQRNFDFAVTQLRPGQTVVDITVKETQGTRVTDANRGLYVDNFNGKTRTFGSQDSLNAFISRTGR